MVHVALGGTSALSLPVRTGLVQAGWRVVTGSPGFRIVNGADVSPDDADATRDYVLAGGRLLILGEGGPLLARLHLTRLMEPMDPAVSGLAEPVQAPFEPVELSDVSPVTGVGYALLRIGGHSGDYCVGVGGPRGEGHVVYIADLDPPPELVLAALGWLAGRA